MPSSGRWVVLFTGRVSPPRRRPTLPVAARRRKVRLSPFPPDGENCDRALAPPLPGEPAALSFAGSTGEINQNATGDAADGLRLRFAPPRSIGPLSPDPITGVNPSARQIISGAQNLSGFLRFLPGHWALGLQKLLLLRFHNCAWPCRANAPGPFSAVGATLAVARNMGRPVSGPYEKKGGLLCSP